jgi:putative transposase
LKQLTKALVERALDTELTAHLGHKRHDDVGNPAGNVRNGRTQKTITGEFGAVDIEIPRDRAGTFRPQLTGWPRAIAKHQRRFSGFDERILSLYARGMSTREIEAHLMEMYGAEVSPTLISSITDAVNDEIKLWQSRPLDPCYAIVYLDCLMLKVRDAGSVSSRAVYLAVGVNLDGMKEVLGIWTAQTEGAKFWLAVITELKNRGVADILIACVDGLKGFPEATGWPRAIEAVFPHTEVQLCLVHLVRHSLKYVTWKEREAVAKDLKTIYSATTVDEAEVRLNEFAERWDDKYPTIAKSWRANWVRIIPLFAYSAEIRKAIYTTNAIESVNFSLRKLTKIRGSFPNDEAAVKLLYLGLRNITKRWTMAQGHPVPIPNWKKALNQLMIKFEDRLTTA